MYKIGIIGRRDTVLAFMALGFSVHEAESVEDATRQLHVLARSGEYAVLFLTEDFAAQMQEETDRYKDQPLPAVISIPAQNGSTGFGRNSIRSAVERAVGADILFKES